ncbi:hypothetical protein U9M48_008680 [Paspalum notatum var. saurae]|uniref:Reverse transcriptase Ty1/copia-type domain-containing protein n=1 Tax=Paspalum notatum var. saurae TaxID=547442 RepID=A0AAQ3SPS2_PASNO
MVCRLNKSLYGLKQAPRAWYSRFATFLVTLGFTEAKSDTSLFVYRHGDEMAYLLLHVDDIVLTASSQHLLHRIITSLQQECAMKDLGVLHHFLGVTVEPRPSDLLLHQRQYTLDILERAGMTDLSHLTRPDITYAVQQACLHMHDPREPHLTALKRLLRYLRGTVDYGLLLHRSSSAELVVYTDTDWAECPDTRRSTSGYAFFLGGNLVSWSSKQQPVVSRFSAEAEYRAVANGVAEASWLRQLLAELHSPLAKSTLIYCDNVNAVYLSTNPVQHQRTKHVEIDLHFVRDRSPSAMFEFYTPRPPPSWLTSSPRVYPLRSCPSSVPASTSLMARVESAGGCYPVRVFSFLASLKLRCAGSSDCEGVLEYVYTAHIMAHGGPCTLDYLPHPLGFGMN